MAEVRHRKKAAIQGIGDGNDVKRGGRGLKKGTKVLKIRTLGNAGDKRPEIRYIQKEDCHRD